MNQLIQVRINKVFCAKNDEETEFDKFNEIVLLCDTPDYICTNKGRVIRQRGIKELRFSIADQNFDAFIEEMQKLRSAKKSELG